MIDQYDEKLASLAAKLQIGEEEIKYGTYVDFFYVYGIVDKYVNRVLGTSQVTPAGYNILHILILNGGSMIATEISKKAWRSRCSVTKVLDTLEKLGYIKRNLPTSDTDRRTKVIEITPQGLEIVEQVTLKVRNQLCNEIMAGLTDRQLSELKKIFQQIAANSVHLLSGTRVMEKKPRKELSPG